jgi:hypothetical protein
MNDARCTICGQIKGTSVPYPLCHVHAEELFRGILQSNTSRTAENARRRVLRAEIAHQHRSPRRYAKK